MEIVPESAWGSLFEELMRHKGTALFIGATDSGKSTLVRYLIKRLVSENISVCLVDSDVGQSSLSLPGTISMKKFRSYKDLEEFRFEKMSYAGTINPATRIPYIINETKRMADICKKKSLFTFVDTTGLISGEAGLTLKTGKINAVKPAQLISIQQRDEAEHILKHFENLSIYRIRRSIIAKTRSTEERASYRKKRYEEYFNNKELTEFLLKSDDGKFFYNDRRFNPKSMSFKNGTLIGLNHNKDTIALGVIDEMRSNSITFISPIKSLKNINNVLFGDIKIDLPCG
jgi:polynucleotide 5'-kinase involved in rRNA processing